MPIDPKQPAPRLAALDQAFNLSRSGNNEIRFAFLTLAFGSLDFLAGQVVGKGWAVLASIPFIRLLRRVTPSPA